MAALLVLPVLIPLLTAIGGLLLRSWPRGQRVVGATGALLTLAAALALLRVVTRDGVVATQIGGWPAPFGITFVADLLSATMVTLTAVIGLAVACYSFVSMDERREAYGYYPLFHVVLMGVCGAFLTGDVFNLFVWFEVMLIASFVLLALGGERPQMEGALKYVTINLIASALFLIAAGMLYAVTGTLNMAGAAVAIEQDAGRAPVTAIAMLFLVAFGIKAAVFPLFSWLPSSYHTPPIPIAALFAGILTKVGVYALIRFFTLLFVGDTAYTHTLLLVVAGLTMLSGVLGAVAQNEVRRILSFHIISQIGYMVMGLALFTPLALAGSIFYIIHHMIVKTNLFLIGGVLQRLGGTGELARLGGVARSFPALGVLFLIPALSLAGLPPFSGFFAKLALLQAGLALDAYLIVGVALLVSPLTLISMMKIWAEAFWKPPPAAPPRRRRSPDTMSALLAPVVALALCTVLIGVFVEPVFGLAERAAAQLLNPTAYIAAVREAQQ